MLVLTLLSLSSVPAKYSSSFSKGNCSQENNLIPPPELTISLENSLLYGEVGQLLQGGY